MATKPILIISTPCLIVDLSIRPRIMMAPMRSHPLWKQARRRRAARIDAGDEKREESRRITSRLKEVILRCWGNGAVRAQFCRHTW